MSKLKTGTTIGGSTAWHAGNDGTGSGLDADTLDGQEGTYYLNDGDFSSNGFLTRTSAGVYSVDTNTYLTAETSHADVLVDGDFSTAGFMKTDGSGTYSVDSNTYLTAETSHADVLVDGDFASAGFMKTNGSGTYSVDTASYLSLAGGTMSGIIYSKGATTSDATQPGAIILASGGTQASPSTAGRGLEFLTSTANNGYGHRLVSFDNTGGDIPLLLQRRNNAAAWTTQITFQGNSNAVDINGAFSCDAITSTGNSVFAGNTEHIIFNEPANDTDWQTVARFGTAAAGVYITSDSPLITSGGYYNGGWISTQTYGSMVDFKYDNGGIAFKGFNGVTVPNAPVYGDLLTIDKSGNGVFTGTIAAPSGNVFVGKSEANVATDGTNIASTSIVISASSGNTYHVYNTNTSTYPFVVSFDGNVTAGTINSSSLGVGTTPSATTGEIRATNNITAYYSDERLKNLEKPIDSAVEKVKQLTGYYFTENEKAKELGYDNPRRQVGVSAQEVEKVLPEVVTSAPINEEYKSVWYDKLVPLLIQAIKEQQEEIDKLKEILNES